MRQRVKQGGITVNAIAGTHVVFLGLDVTQSKRAGLRGFGFRRHNAQTGEVEWVRGMKTFASIEPHPTNGERFSSREHPWQGFQWADYSVAPGGEYTYDVVALYGEPGDLKVNGEATVSVTTERETDATHSAFFNRGSVATQEYARRFQNQPPSVAGAGAYEWLSRGLLEALLAFLARADGPAWSIHAAVYEFQWPAVLEAVKDAHARGATVRVIYDDIEAYDKKGDPKGPFQKNRDAIAAAKIKSLCTGRANGRLMHNKFFVLSRNDVPVAVWTGSTNLTENGIFGHSNVGQVCEDRAVARTYLEYWERLKDDPEIGKEYRDVNSALVGCPPDPWEQGTTVVFSPRGTTTKLEALDWYADIAREARNGLFMTFAFGMHKSFKDVYRMDDDILRMALLEKAGNNASTLEQEKADLQEIRNRPNVLLAMGNRIRTNSFDRWLTELDRVHRHVHVQWIHTKYMLVDPLGDDPIVVSGSANFSKASCCDNDENMLVIRGDRRVADIYFGEYMRLYAHYAFRESVARALEKEEAGTPEEWKPQYLVEDDSWMHDYIAEDDRSARRARREYFAGPMAV